MRKFWKASSIMLCTLALSIFLASYYTRLHNMDLAYNFKNMPDSCELMVAKGETGECKEYCDEIFGGECVPYGNLYSISFYQLVWLPLSMVFLSFVFGFMLSEALS